MRKEIAGNIARWGFAASAAFGPVAAARAGGEPQSPDTSELQSEQEQEGFPIVIVNEELASNLNLRAGPSTENEIIASLRPGTELEVVDTNDDQSWFNVEWFNEETGFILRGWVSSDFVSEGEVESTIADVSPGDMSEEFEMLVSPKENIPDRVRREYPREIQEYNWSAELGGFIRQTENGDLQVWRQWKRGELTPSQLEEGWVEIHDTEIIGNRRFTLEFNSSLMRDRDDRQANMFAEAEFGFSQRQLVEFEDWLNTHQDIPQNVSIVLLPNFYGTDIADDPSTRERAIRYQTANDRVIGAVGFENINNGRLVIYIYDAFPPQNYTKEVQESNLSWVVAAGIFYATSDGTESPNSYLFSNGSPNDRFERLLDILRNPIEETDDREVFLQNLRTFIHFG